MRVLMMADTHVPKRARHLPEQLWDAAGSADVVIHAGDWVDESVLDALQKHCRRMIGVYGNNDGPRLRARLPEIAHATLGGLRFSVIHETGQATGREARCDATFPETDVLVFGHSHIPWDTVTPEGMRLLNPGSPTDRRRQLYATYLTATVAAGRMTGVVLHRIER